MASESPAQRGDIDEEGPGHAPRFSCRLNNSLLSHEDDLHEYIHDEEAANSEEDVSKKTCGSSFCKFYNNHQLGFVIWGAVLGVALGIGLAYWKPENQDTKNTVLLWVGLVGQLFLRALKCVILPMVFCSITISVMDMLALGKAGTMVAVTICLYLFTTICAVCLGILSSLAFSSKYVVDDSKIIAEVTPEVRLGCSVDGTTGAATSFLTETDGGSVVCVAGAVTSNSTFLMEDLNGYYATASTGPTQLSLSESLYQGLFMQLIGPNMLGLFVDNNFLGVIVLGAAFGVALTRLASNPPKGVKWTQIITIQILEEFLQIFMMFVNWIIWCAPFCILSLVATAIGKQSDMRLVIETLGWLFASFMVAAVAQVSFCYCGLYFAFLRANPLKYYYSLIEALTLAFATASSAATLPVSMECVVKSGKVPPGVARFVLPLGATVNMDGTAIYIVCSCVALAYLNGIVPTAADYIIIGLSATLGSIGTAPVPSASIVLIITTYQTTFGGSDVPYGIEFIFAIDWLIDRFRTVFNVCGDTVVAALVASRLDESETEEFLKKVDAVEKGNVGDIDTEHEKTERMVNKIEECEIANVEGLKKSVVSA